MNTTHRPIADLAGRSVLITGATGGLGSAIAANLAARGATLTLVARNEQRLNARDVVGHKLALDLRDPSACPGSPIESLSAIRVHLMPHGVRGAQRGSRNSASPAISSVSGRRELGRQPV